MRIIAHRGASGYFTENTMPAFKAALAMGSDYFETDVQLSKDGFLVIYHDYTLPAGHKIKDIIFKDLVKYNIPRIQDVLDILGPRIKLNLEIKNDGNIYPGIEEKLIHLLNTYPAAYKGRILISSFDLDTLKRVLALAPDIKIGRLARDFDIKEVLDLNAYSLNISAARVNKKIIETCHKQNIKVLVYTVNDLKAALELQNIGVDGIFSDYPDIMCRNYLGLGLTE